MAGRKSLKDEMAVLKRFEQLSPQVFEYLTKCLNGESKEDKKWAMDWLKAGYAKMIPQKIGGDPNDRTPIPILGVQNVPTNNGNQQNTQAQQENTGDTGGNIGEQDNLNTPIPDKPGTVGQADNLNLNSLGILSSLETGRNEGLQEHNQGA